MSLTSSIKIASIGGAIAAAAVVFSFAAHAGPGSPGPRCQGMTKEKVIKCCEQMIVNSSYRRIMGTSGRCEGAVVCVRAKRGGTTYGLAVAGSDSGQYRCWLRKIKLPQSDNDHPQPEGGRRTGGNQGQGNTPGIAGKP